MYTPKPLQWDDALTTGDETLDDQHKYLVDTLNTLGEAINEGHGTDMISRILGRLRFYAGWLSIVKRIASSSMAVRPRG